MLIEVSSALYAVTNDCTEVFRVPVLEATVMVEALVSISSRLTPLMADVILLLDDSMAMPSMVYSALTGGLPAL
ncbi:hypothetical protein D3C81_2236840 [compost metagenome]